MPRKSFLDSISSPKPCPADWDEMVGDEKKRFCLGCGKDVYNLSALSRSEARRFAVRNAGKVCIRYVRLPNGKVATERTILHQLTRQPSLATGVLAAAISLNVAANVQPVSGQSISTKDQKTFAATTKKRTKTCQVEFTVVDALEHAIEGAEIRITYSGSENAISGLTNNEGVAVFPGLPCGRFHYSVTARGLRSHSNWVLSTLPIEPPIFVKLEVGTVGEFVVMDYEVPLFDYIAREENGIVQKNIQSGFDVKTKSQTGRTALHVAVEHGNFEIVKLLIAKGADVNAKLANKQTPIWMLEDAFEDEEDQGKALAIFRYLVAKGANVDAQDEDGQTLLMIMAEDDDVETVKLLLDSGAKVGLKDKDGETAFDRTTSDEIRKILTDAKRSTRRKY